MSRRKRELTGEETELWRRVAETVKLRRKAPRTPAPAGKAAAPAKPAAKAPAKPRMSEPPRSAAPSAPPADRGGEKRVRRGRLDIGATLDLHGHTQTSGRAALKRFLARAFADGAGAVIIVTGVGRLGQGVLKRQLPEWLAEPDLRPLVSGYAQAHRNHGGAGAYYVFLKRRRD